MGAQASRTTAPQATTDAASTLHRVDRPRVARPDSGYEREAAAVADTIGRGRTTTRASISRLPRQAPAVRDSREPFAPTSVHEVIDSPGEPLHPRARRAMQQRVDFDFGQVRVHAGPRAAASARSIGALAYTAGRHVVLGERHDSRLLAHELTHVVQQSSAPLDAPAIVQRATVAESIGRGLRDFFFFVPSLFGAELSYGDDELLEYLQEIDDQSAIDGGYYADDKARQIVTKSRAGDAKFPLTPKQSRLLMMEMEDGIITDGDRTGILDLMQKCLEEEVSIDFVFAPGGLSFRSVMSTMRKEPFHARYAAILTPWYVKDKVSAADAPQATRILRDLLAVKEGTLDFTDLPELHAEVTKRLRTTQLMKESQNNESFDYPENMRDFDCSDFRPGDARRNARVNLAARPYWTDVILDSELSYYFKLTDFGREHAFDALTKLFTPQGLPPADRTDTPDPSICKKTLIHCDYVTSVIHFRVFAEAMGPATFDEKVKSGAIRMWLTWHGFPKKDMPEEAAKSPIAKSLQWVQPASEADLVIGDHVVFWNHLAYDGLNIKERMPWRLENAILVDQDSSGADLFQGHGTAPKTHKEMREELKNAYNPFAKAAIELVNDGDLAALEARYPAVKQKGEKWVVEDPGDDEARKGRLYDLRTVDDAMSDPEMPGLRDPHDPTKLSPVKRPVESAEGRPPAVE